MILDIPDSNEFKLNGIAFLNLAWESIVSLCENLESVLESLDPDEAMPDADREREFVDYEKAYWKQNKQELAVAIALTQQGAEFLLKWKISLVSPFLLLAGDSAAKWSGTDKSFADFKTVDAQDLVRIHDTVSAPKLSENFKQSFERFRKLRNTVMHSVDRRHSLKAEDALLAILETANALLGERSWPRVRQQYYEDKSNVIDQHYYHYTDDTLARQIWQVLQLLEPAEIRRCFEFAPKQRCYYCPACASNCSDIGLIYKVAQLKPNAANSTNLFCVACGENTKVERTACLKEDCRGNVLAIESGACLSCNSRQ